VIAFHSYSEREARLRGEFLDLVDWCPIPREVRLDNLALFIRRQVLARYLFADRIYQKILDVPGSILVFGVLWGQDLALFESLHGIYEPYNYTRQLVGFDTFAGFPAVSDEDGQGHAVVPGAYSTSQAYEDYLTQVLEYHEQEAPIPHLRRFRLVKGDVCKTLEAYLSDEPQTVVALAYIDIDLFEPTRDILRLVVDHMPRGGVIVFDELNLKEFPGETLALDTVLGLSNCRLRRDGFHPTASYMVIGD